jgi:hypothetical protein
MTRDQRKPGGVGDIEHTDDAFTTSVSVLDEDGYFRGECPSCEAPFKMRQDEYEALPDEIGAGTARSTAPS